jgi:hypothetical protein
MNPRELVEELVGGSGAAGLHVLIALAHAFDGIMIILTLLFQVVGQDVVEGVGGALAASARELAHASERSRTQRSMPVRQRTDVSSTRSKSLPS